MTQQPKIRVAILGGAGAMGAVFGARLFQAGHDVTLIDVAKAAVDTINAEGLRIASSSGESQVFQVPATVSPPSVGEVDVVINFVKCYQTEPAVRSVLALLREDSYVLSLQNGWGNAPVIANLVGEERVLAGVTYHSATVLGPGQVLHAGQGNTFVGALVGDPERARPLVKAFISAGLDATLAQDVRIEIWKKLALNICTLPTAALLRFPAGELVEHQGTLALMKHLLTEGVAVARAQEIPLDENERWEVVTTLLKRAKTARASMLQDVDHQRRTEIDVINGAIVAAGRLLGLATPYNEAMVWMVKSLEETFVNPAKEAS